ncbi:hypothetical protein HHI36_021616 [Cryptolaemus montrouzieri]|uniref:Uncharacterized protein n=1 Tax=Cryptolaemus montrouzieri TaxID=559131 RepID=A0ABD2MY71_9CUCU
MYQFGGFVLCLIFLQGCVGHPTIYRYNDEKNLEPALVPVSSTVIPLDAYQVGYGLNVRGGKKKAREYPPETLITVKTKMKIQDKETF